MIDNYISYLQNQLSNYHPEKTVGVDLMCPIVIIKTKTKIKVI